MSVFGDDEPADAYDPSGTPDPEQVARRLQRLLYEAGLDARLWSQLNLAQQSALIEVLADLLDWLRREGDVR